MTALIELEALRDAALAELKEASLELKSLIDDEERILKENRKKRFEVEKRKVKIGAQVLAATACLDRLTAAIPREILNAIAERTAKIGADDFQLREHKRDLQARQFEMKQLVAAKTRPAELVELRGVIVQLEATVAELEEDLEDQRKGLAAAEGLHREALEDMEPQAKKELEALRAPA